MLTYGLLGGLLHRDLSSFVQLGEHLQGLVIVSLLTQACRHLNLILHFLRVVHDENRHDALRLNRLTVRAIAGAVNDNLSLNWLDHGLLHEHAARLLHACSHVHGRHSLRGVSLPIHHHLLLLIMALATSVVVSLMGTWLSVDNRWLTKDLRVCHLAHANLLEVHWLRLWLRVVRHRYLLRVHIRLLLVLVHLLGAAVLTTLVDWLAQLMHAVRVSAIVLVRTRLPSAEVLADHRLVVLEVLAAALSRVVRCSLEPRVTTSATTATALPPGSLEVIAVSSVHAAAHVAASATRGSHASTATAAHSIVLLIVVVAALSTIVVRLVASAAAVVLVSATTAVVASVVLVTASPVKATATAALVPPSVVVVALVLASLVLTGRVVHGPLVGDDSAASLQAHVIRNRLERKGKICEKTDV